MPLNLLAQTQRRCRFLYRLERRNQRMNLNLESAQEARPSTTKPYYQDDQVTLYHGDAFEFIAGMEARSVDAVMTDPPYDERTHTMARSNNTGAPAGGRALSGSKGAFVSFTYETHLSLFESLGRITRGWVVSSLNTSTAFRFELDPPAGLKCLRIGVWVKTNPMPILSADRPALGWEPIVCLYRDDAKPKWFGGGRTINHTGPTSQGSGHPTQKPIEMIRNWVRQFTAPGDLIFDPFAGTGTTLRAASDEGRSKPQDTVRPDLLGDLHATEDSGLFSEGGNLKGCAGEDDAACHLGGRKGCWAQEVS